MRTILVAVVALACSAPAFAQQLTLDFHEGRVSLDAAGVPVRTILSEWARLGGTNVVGGERVSGAPLTLKLENVPESQALEIILRNVAGYMAAPRRAESVGASLYDRILVLPTSTTAAAATAPAGRPGANGPNAAGAQRGGRPGFAPPQPSPDEAAQGIEEPDATVNEPPFQFPQPGQNPFQQMGQPGQAGPFGTPVPPGGQPPVVQFGPGGDQAVTINPSPQQDMPVLTFPGAPPAGGMGPFGSPTPGVVIQPANPVLPGIRPPGSE